MRHARLLLLMVLSALLAAPAAALDDEHWKLADDAIDKGIVYLRDQQQDDGSWMPHVGPAVTGLVLTALLERPDIGPDDPAAAKAIRYILDRVQDDGSIRNGPDGILPSYNTAICLSALARVGNDPEVAEAINKGQQYLRGSQWIIGMTDPNGEIIDEDHPFVGGFGYGKHGRPDLSNTQIALQALYDTGVDCEDPAFQRALVFLNRLQATEDNDLYADQMAEHDGGFIYAPSLNKDHINTPESKANPDEMDEALNGATVSGLRTYGGMTYAGFKSLLFANLDRDDKRVQAALGWIANNYEFDVNPGMPEELELHGLYYYYLTMARAMNAWGSSTIDVNTATKAVIQAGRDAPAASIIQAMDELAQRGITDISVVATDGEAVQVVESPATEPRDWANDLIAKLVSAQHEDGYWANQVSRWMEDQPVLVTAYSVLALQNAID